MIDLSPKGLDLAQPLAIEEGGTGADGRQDAMDNLSGVGAACAGQVLLCDGSRVGWDWLYPPGAVCRFAGALPPGWMACRGQLLAESDYPRLFAAIGAAYGSSGAGTFRVPDLKESKAPISAIFCARQPPLPMLQGSLF